MLSNSYHLQSGDDVMKKVFVAADEPVDVRRKKVMARLKRRAVENGQHVEEGDDGCLHVMVSWCTLLRMVKLVMCSVILMAESAHSNLLRFVSFNSRGYNLSKKSYIHSILTGCDLLLLRKHWLSDDQLTCLNDFEL